MAADDTPNEGSFVFGDDLRARLSTNLARHERFAAHMPDPAYLCVAASESLLTVTSRFELKTIGGAFVYMKRAAGATGQHG